MADDTADKKNDASKDEPAKKGGVMGLLSKLPVLIGGVMTVEAVVLFVALKGFGGPAAAEAHGPEGHAEVAYQLDDHGEPVLDDHGNPIPLEPHPEGPELVEVPVDSFRAQNQLDGRTYLYDVDISVQVPSEFADEVKAKLEGSTGLVRDRMTRIIRSIDPQKLNGTAEPGLETLRRQVRYQLDLIVGEGLIEEVLVPRCIPYRTSY